MMQLSHLDVVQHYYCCAAVYRSEFGCASELTVTFLQRPFFASLCYLTTIHHDSCGTRSWRTRTRLYHTITYTSCSYIMLVSHDGDHIPLLSSAVACWGVRRNETIALPRTNAADFRSKGIRLCTCCWNYPHYYTCMSCREIFVMTFVREYRNA